MSDPGPGRDPSSEVEAEKLLDQVMDSFAERVRQGERPSVEELATRHPELADRIRELLTALAFVEKAQGERPTNADPCGTTDGAAPAGPTLAKEIRRLGDYRLLRELGRGGMGVVYEAEQESLGRRVALKILPFHALMDPRRLDRFRREARSAAALQHPNIVPVHGVGEENGVHYYVMQFIPGQGLDEVLVELRRLRSLDGPAEIRPLSAASSLLFAGIEPVGVGGAQGESGLAPDAPAVLPSGPPAPAGLDSDRQFFRNVARLGVQAAGALAYAHGQGVLHRDIKPSNLLLDSGGTLWVTDFGLAKAEGSDDITQSGEILGTLRYLPPERLKGWSDPRSDVYSLGLTLYELLTLQPAFDDTDRGRLVKKITDEDPARPRRIDPKIPRDLETIVWKAIAKEPGQRYATAADLSGDLGRFLGGEPVLARPSSTLERGVKWARRRPAAAALVVVSALALLTVLGGSLWYNALLRKESAQARANLGKALDAVSKMLTWVGDEGLAAVPQIQPVRKGLLEEALRLHQGFLAENEKDPVVRFETARAYSRVGQIQQVMGQRLEARESYRQSIVLLEKLGAGYPESPQYRDELATVQSLVSLLDEDSLPAKGAVVSRFALGTDAKGTIDAVPADFSGDGMIDLAAVNRHSSNVSLLLNHGDRTFVLSGVFAVGSGPYDAEAADLDGDAAPDLVTMDQGSQSLSVLRNAGKGTFARATLHGLGFAPWAMATADLDGDRIPEVAVVGTGLRVLRRKDDAFALEEVEGVPGAANGLAAGDFDGDGRADLAVGGLDDRKQGLLSVFWNKGDGTFPSTTNFPQPSLAQFLLSADLDGDRDLDLAASDYLGESITVTVNTGRRTFQPGVRFPFPPGPLCMAAADLDGDQDIDLVSSYEITGVVSVLLNDGKGKFPSVARFTSGGEAFRGCARDLDGDGKIDLAIANGNVNDVAVMFHVRELVNARAAEAPREEKGEGLGGGPDK